MRSVITIAAMFLWVIWSAAYAGTHFQPHEWWSIPLALTVVLVVAGLILFLGLLWDGVIIRKK